MYPKTKEDYLEIYRNITNLIKYQEEHGITGIESTFPKGELSMLKRCYKGQFGTDIAEENSELEIKEAKIAKAVAATGLSEQQIRQMISNGKMPMGPWIALMKEEQE